LPIFFFACVGPLLEPLDLAEELAADSLEHVLEKLSLDILLVVKLGLVSVLLKIELVLRFERLLL